MMMSAYERLNQLAQELVGDDKSPNIYFVTQDGRVLTVTTDRRTAYLQWRQLASTRPRIECALEDREHGIVCSVERDEGGRLQARDDYHQLTGDAGIAEWETSQLIDYARSERTPTVRQTVCRHCGQDIEGHAPFNRATWRDRGNNTHCASGAQHTPVPE